MAMEFAVTMPAVVAVPFPAAPPVVVPVSTPAVMIPVPAESPSTPVVTVPAAPIIPAAIVTTTIKASAIPARMAVIPVIPGSHANKYAVHKIIWPVEAIGRASVGVIIIVAVSANRGRTNISRAVIAGANSNTYNHSLCARERSAKQANAE